MMNIGHITILAVALTAVAAKLSCARACPKNFRFICGSDGITYGNICTFRCAQGSDPSLTLRHEGECEDCKCLKEYKPVCSPNGKTYPNLCSLNCAKPSNPNLKFDHEGECKSKRVKKSTGSKPNCPCTRELRRVCGSDGESYSNPCILRCAAKANPGLKVAHEGSC